MIRFAPTRIIDIAPFFSGGDPATDRAVAEALSDHGSFVATGFAGAEGFAGKIADLLSFFSMEEAHKLECATCRHVPRNPNIYRGFYPLPDRPHWSHNEIFDIGPEPAMTSPDVPGAESFRESNVWPSVEPVVDWRGRMLAMLDFQRALALVLMASIARGLGLEEEALLAPARGRNATLRLLHYAPAPPDFALRGADGDEPEGIGDGRRLIAASHVDTGLLSLLWQDEAGGLQMRGPDGGVAGSAFGARRALGALWGSRQGAHRRSPRRHAPPRRRPRWGSVLGRILPGAGLRDGGRRAGRRPARELRAAPRQRVCRTLRGAASGVRVMQGRGPLPIAGLRSPAGPCA